MEYPPPKSVVPEWTQLTKPAMNVWCPHCALSSAHTVDWLVTLTVPRSLEALRGWIKPENESRPLLIAEYRRVRYCEEGCEPTWVPIQDDT